MALKELYEIKISCRSSRPAQYILGLKIIILSEALLRNNNSYFKWDNNFEYRYM